MTSIGEKKDFFSGDLEIILFVYGGIFFQKTN